MSDRVIGGRQEEFEFRRGLKGSFRAIRLGTEVITHLRVDRVREGI